MAEKSPRSRAYEEKRFSLTGNLTLFRLGGGGGGGFSNAPSDKIVITPTPKEL